MHLTAAQKVLNKNDTPLTAAKQDLFRKFDRVWLDASASEPHDTHPRGL